jgi:hypothetical protein
VPIDSNIDLALAAEATLNIAPQRLKPPTIGDCCGTTEVDALPEPCGRRFGWAASSAGSSTGEDARSSTISRGRLLLYCFFLDHDLQVRGHIFMQLHGDGELANRLQRLMQLNLAAIDIEALFDESISQVARRH